VQQKILINNIFLTKQFTAGLIMYEIHLDKCVRCGVCVKKCPVDAIIKHEDKYIINDNKCVSCGICKNECKFNAIQINKKILNEIFELGR